MSLPVKFTDESLQAMLKDLEEAYPNEGCGFLYGDDGDLRTIKEAVKVINSKEGDQRRRFEIKPTDYMKAERYADENNLKLIGIYHSHPNHPARPSEHDLKQAFPFFSYVIVSVNDGKAVDVTSWQLDENEKFYQEEITNKTIKIN